MPKREWTELDEQAAREGDALKFMEDLNTIVDESSSPDHPQDINEPTSQQRALLDRIHPMGKFAPLGHCLTIAEAADDMNIPLSTAYHLLKQLERYCPNTYAEWRKWPSPQQMQIWMYLHPKYGNMSISEVAEFMDMTESAVKYHITNLHKTHPNAFLIICPKGKPKHFISFDDVDETKIIKKF